MAFHIFPVIVVIAIMQTAEYTFHVALMLHCFMFHKKK
jgi:hypothetical protein